MQKEELLLVTSLAGFCGLAGYTYLNRIEESANAGVEKRRKEEMKRTNVKEVKPVLVDDVVKDIMPTCCDGPDTKLAKGYIESLTDHIKAMSPDELEIVIEAIPVSYCLKRIQSELDHAREFETMIKKAYEMR